MILSVRPLSIAKGGSSLLVLLPISHVFNKFWMLPKANDRKVALTGHDVEKIVRTALKLNKLHLPSDDILIPIKISNAMMMIRSLS